MSVSDLLFLLKFFLCRICHLHVWFSGLAAFHRLFHGDSCPFHRTVLPGLTRRNIHRLNVKSRLFCVPVHENRQKHGRRTSKTVSHPRKGPFLWMGTAQSMRSESFGVDRATCFEQLAGVFAICGTLHYAKILASLKIKKGISLTPLNCALNAFTLALNDSADAFVERLSKKFSIVG